MSALSSRKQGLTFEERQQQKKQKLRNADLRIQNLTRALTVVEADKDVDRDLVRVVLRNDYKKTITAYKVGVGAGTIQTELATEQEILSPFGPGETREEFYALQVDIETLGISVLAVMFDDRTADGVPQFVQEIRDYRLGVRMGIEKALNSLDGVSQLSEAEIPGVLGRLRGELLSRSGPEERMLPHFVKVGFHDATERIARDLTREHRELPERPQQNDSVTSQELTTKLFNRLAQAASTL